MDGIRLVQRNATGPNGMVELVELVLELPASFPDRYREAVTRAADQCTVKQHLELPPHVVIRANAPEPAAEAVAQA